MAPKAPDAPAGAADRDVRTTPGANGEPQSQRTAAAQTGREGAPDPGAEGGAEGPRAVWYFSSLWSNTDVGDPPNRNLLATHTPAENPNVAAEGEPGRGAAKAYKGTAPSEQEPSNGLGFRWHRQASRSLRRLGRSGGPGGAAVESGRSIAVRYRRFSGAPAALIR